MNMYKITVLILFSNDDWISLSKLKRFKRRIKKIFAIIKEDGQNMLRKK